MNNTFSNMTKHIVFEQMPERSFWYGANLLTILATSSQTSGAFSLIKNLMRRGFEPPLHVHTREDESNYILEGEIEYEVGDRIIRAKKGDYVFLPRELPHTFRLITDTAETLLLITPGGFEEMFIQCSRPALAMELPPLGEKPPQAFFEKITRISQELGASFVPNF